MSRREVTPPPRFAFLVRNLETGGVQRSQIRLAGAIAARGYRVDLVACSPGGAASVPAGVRLVRLRRSPKLLARMLPLVADPRGMGVLAPALIAKSRPSPTMPCLPDLVRYLRWERQRDRDVLFGKARLLLPNL